MASSLAAGFCSFYNSYPKKQKKKQLKFPQVISSSQSFKDEGNKRADIVDANMSTLRKRIDEMKKKKEEMMMKMSNNNNFSCCRVENGWNYKPGYDHNHKRSNILYGSIQIMSFVGGAVAFVFLTSSLCIFLVSFFIHFSCSTNY